MKENIELYINGKLCNLSSDFSVRLNLQTINPKEFALKQAQYSYSISLPITDSNNDAFKYANIEETREKFNRIYPAELNINGVRIFKGLFRLTAITRDKYKGNLYVPKPVEVKDLFSNLMMNQNAPYPIPFDDFATSFRKYNVKAKDAPQPAIFPYVLYGVPARIAKNDGTYSEKNILDGTERVGLSDVPPSVNVIKLLDHLFKSKGYKLTGQALKDKRLTELYMSYHNPADYQMQWNWGKLGKMHLEGFWRNTEGYNTAKYEKIAKKIVRDDGVLYACNLFNSTNANIEVKEDFGGNISQKEQKNGSFVEKTTILTIPVSGYYKIAFESKTILTRREAISNYDEETSIKHVNLIPNSKGLSVMRTFLKILRDRGKGDFVFDLQDSKIDGILYRDNLPQNSEYNEENAPKYVPNTSQDGVVVFVDPKQNPYHLVGFQCGKKTEDDVIPTAKTGKADTTARITAGKTALSWDAETAKTYRNYIAINSKGYRKYNGKDWEDSKKFECSVINSPENTVERIGEDIVKGKLNCIAWLEAGERLSIVDVSDEITVSYNYGDNTGWCAKTVAFDLTIEPFQTKKDWLVLDPRGEFINQPNWHSATDFDTDQIDLIKFLPSDIKTDDFISNFCKAFNLNLTQQDADTFRLEFRKIKTGNRYVDFDKKVSVNDRANAPLDMPSAYKIGFTINPDEEGYRVSNDDGSGMYNTGYVGGNVLEHNSIFSYNWFKDLKQMMLLLPVPMMLVLSVPIISKKEVWDSTEVYPEVAYKRFTDLPIRFWYFKDIHTQLKLKVNGKSVDLAKVSNELKDECILTYKNQEKSLLNSFFLLPFKGSSHYTEIEAYLTIEDFEMIKNGASAIFNGDIYLIAELQGYDPTGRNRTKIKLIRRT